MRKTVPIIGLFLLSGCGSGSNTPQGQSASPPSTDKILSASISSSDKGLALAKSSSSRLASSRSSSLADTLLNVKVDGSLSEVEFEVESTDPATQQKTLKRVSIPIQDIKPLTENMVALKISDGRVGILNKTSAEVYDVSGVNFDEMTMNGTFLYSLNTFSGQLYRIDLSDPLLTMHPVNDIAGSSYNTGFPTAIFSSYNSPSSPFMYLGGGVGQIAGNVHSDDWRSSSFLLLDNDMVAATAGPSGGKRVMLFKESAPTFDCQLAALFDIGGGGSGGVIQTADKSLYHIYLGASDLVARYDLSMSGNCASATTALDMGSGHITHWGNSLPLYKVNYKLTDTTRYILAPDGFLKTYLNGSGAIAMTWTSLNLSDVPSEMDFSNALLAGYADNKLVVLEGDYLYYVKNGAIYYQLLQSGTSPVLFSNPGSIDFFDVVGGQVLYSSSGKTFSVETAGGTPKLISSEVSIRGGLKF